MTRVAVVTGAASGLGAATAKLLAERGDTVVGLDLHACETDGGSHVVDVSDRSAVDAAIADILAVHGSIDVVVTCAGTAAAGGLLDMDPTLWDRILAINIGGTAHVCRAVIPAMATRGRGAVVTIGSTFGLLARDMSGCYGVSKAAVAHLTRSLAVDLEGSGVRVNCVCPGLVETPLTWPVFDPRHGDLLRRNEEMHALRRTGTPREIAEAIAFLASDEASFITGAVLPVDGGYTAGKWTSRA